MYLLRYGFVRYVIRVIKVGGNELDSALFCEGLAQAVARAEQKVVVVHGGGRAISAQQTALGLPVVKVAGLRVTDAAALAVVVGVLCGNTNKSLVAALRNAGVNAVGLSGVDGGILRCSKMQHPGGDLGLVGQVEQVDPQLLRVLLLAGFTPVLAPIGVGDGGDELGWADNFDETVASLTAAGVELDAGVLEGAPHMFRMDWSTLGPWLEKVQGTSR